MASRVNEKLYHSRLLLTQAAAAEGALRRALAEGALFHLLIGYRAALRELAGDAASAPMDARQLERELQQTGGQAPAVSELAALERTGQWPARILGTWQAVTALQGGGPGAASGGAGALAVVQLADEADAESIAEWLAALQAFVEAQRQFLQEW